MSFMVCHYELLQEMLDDLRRKDDLYERRDEMRIRRAIEDERDECNDNDTDFDEEMYREMIDAGVVDIDRWNYVWDNYLDECESHEEEWDRLNSLDFPFDEETLECMLSYIEPGMVLVRMDCVPAYCVDKGIPVPEEPIIVDVGVRYVPLPEGAW